MSDVLKVVQTPNDTLKELTAWFKSEYAGAEDRWLIEVNNVLGEHKRRVELLKKQRANAREGFPTVVIPRERGEDLYPLKKFKGTTSTSTGVAVHVSRALYDAVYDDVERYNTTIREIVIWRLRVAAGVSRPSSIPQRPLRVAHKTKKRVNGVSGRSMELVWPMSVQQVIRQKTVDIAAETGNPRVENYAEIARAMLAAQYGLDG